MKKSPGSPFRQAHSAILCSTSRALSCRTTFPDRGFTRSYISPFSAAFMNASVTATLMLKLVISLVSVLQVMNSRMSGWSTRRMPILAPRRVPPCLMCSVDWLYTFMNDTGPDATPPVHRTTSSLGRNRENENPVPPPVWWMRSEEHTSELQSRPHLVCRLLLEKKNRHRPRLDFDAEV